MSREQKDDIEMRDADETQNTAGGENDMDTTQGGDGTAGPAAGSKKKSGPSSKKGKKDLEPQEIDPNYPGQRFHIGELIYANYAEGKQWFEAKVLKVEKRADLIYYYLHYQGWGDKFNDWRPYHKDAELMKHDEDGRKVFEEAKLKMKESKAKASGKAPEPETKKKSSGKRKHEDDGDVDDDVQVGGASGEVKLKISGFLKKQLIADWENVTRQHKLVTLPRPTSVTDLLQEFEQSKQRQESSHQMCKEVVGGLEQYFEKALGTVLLYRFERPQYKKMMEKVTSGEMTLSKIYGAEHLLRLFVKLPSLLSYTKMETKEAVVLGSKLNEFIKWLDKKAQNGVLFQAEYEATDKDYAQQLAADTD